MISVKIRILLFISLASFWYYKTETTQTESETIQQNVSSPSVSSDNKPSETIITNYIFNNEIVDNLYLDLVVIPEFKKIIKQFQSHFYNIRYILAPFYKSLIIFYSSMQNKKIILNLEDVTEIDTIFQNMQKVFISIDNLEDHAFITNRFINFTNTIPHQIMSIVRSMFDRFILNKTTLHTEMYQVNSFMNRQSNYSLIKIN